jgi:hypothetical protein
MFSSRFSTSHDFRTFLSNSTLFPHSLQDLLPYMILEPSKLTLLFFLCCFHAFAFSLALTEENWCFRKLPNFHSCHIFGTSVGKTHKIVTARSDLPPILALCCDITQRIVVIPYRRFGATSRSRRRESRNHHTLLNIPEESRSHVFRSGNLKSVGLSFPRTWAGVSGMYELHLYIPCKIILILENKITTFVPNRSSLLRRIRETAGSCHGMSRRTSLEVHAFRSCICMDAGYLFCRLKRTRGAQPTSHVCLFIHQRISLFQPFSRFHPSFEPGRLWVVLYVASVSSLHLFPMFSVKVARRCESDRVV